MLNPRSLPAGDLPSLRRPSYQVVRVARYTASKSATISSQSWAFPYSRAPAETGAIRIGNRPSGTRIHRGVSGTRFQTLPTAVTRNSTDPAEYVEILACIVLQDSFREPRTVFDQFTIERDECRIGGFGSREDERVHRIE